MEIGNKVRIADFSYLTSDNNSTCICHFMPPNAIYVVTKTGLTRKIDTKFGLGTELQDMEITDVVNDLVYYIPSEDVRLIKKTDKICCPFIGNDINKCPIDCPFGKNENSLCKTKNESCKHDYIFDRILKISESKPSGTTKQVVSKGDHYETIDVASYETIEKETAIYKCSKCGALKTIN